MPINSLPQEPEKRRTIIVLSPDRLQQLKQDPANAQFFLNEQVCVLDAFVKDNNPLVEKLRGSGLLNPGSILIQSPYDTSNYTDAVDASYTFAQAKCIHFATFCGFMATQKVSVKQMEIKTSDSKTKFSGGIDTPYGGAGAEGEQSAWERMQKAIKIEREYYQIDPKLDAARAYLSKHQWLTDAHLNSFLDLREAGIPIKKETFFLSVTQESQKNLNVAFSLKVPPYAALNVQLDKIKKESFEFSVEIEVEFWKQ